MITYFNLHRPESERLLGDCSEAAPGLEAQTEILPCPITKEHVGGSRRISPLYVQVKHDRRDDLMIWCWGPGCVVHEQLLGDFAQQGFTGYQIRPATVRFRDGSTSIDYRELIVTGWAGMAAPESGIRVVKSCPACHWKTYSAFNDIERLIDWTQWTGDDFFIVWPLPLFTLITERVAQFLLS